MSGLLRIVDNGVLVFNEEKEMLRNSSSIKPNNLEGKLLGTVCESKLDEVILQLKHACHLYGV